MITIEIRNPGGESRNLEVPEGINLSLMEVLKASEYDIPATCGGMALCATCHVEMIHAGDQLEGPNDAELEMLDTLPDAAAGSRLACQIRIDNKLNGAVFQLRAISDE
jgi:2Fe-2S ferredoxin